MYMAYYVCSIEMVYKQLQIVNFASSWSFYLTRFSCNLLNYTIMQDLDPCTPGAGNSDISVHTYMNKKTKWKTVFFGVEHIKQGMRIGVINAIFQETR